MIIILFSSEFEEKNSNIVMSANIHWRLYILVI